MSLAGNIHIWDKHPIFRDFGETESSRNFSRGKKRKTPFGAFPFSVRHTLYIARYCEIANVPGWPGTLALGISTSNSAPALQLAEPVPEPEF